MPAPAMSIGRCGASCAASTNSRAPCACASRPARATGHTSPVTFEAPVTATRSIRGRAARSAAAVVEQLVRRAGEREQPQVVAAPGEHVGVVLDRAREHARARGSAAARTLIASVVLRTKTTSSSARAPTNAGDRVARVLERGGRDLGLQRRCRGARCCTRARTPRRPPTRRPSPACSPRSRGSRSGASDRRRTAPPSRRRRDAPAPTLGTREVWRQVSARRRHRLATAPVREESRPQGAHGPHRRHRSYASVSDRATG